MKDEGVMAIFCRDTVKNLEKKENEGSKLHQMLQRLAPSEPKFYDE